MPAVASTLLLMMLSLDRYIAIQHPLMFSLIRDENKLPKIMTISSWVVAVLVCSPILIVRSVTLNHTCEEFWLDSNVRKIYVLVFISVLYAIPSLTVGLCHLSVGNRIYATSLMAAAANGDIPLPMPLMTRPKDMIIVASVHELPPVVSSASYSEIYFNLIISNRRGAVSARKNAFVNVVAVRNLQYAEG